MRRNMPPLESLRLRGAVVAASLYVYADESAGHDPKNRRFTIAVVLRR